MHAHNILHEPRSKGIGSSPLLALKVAIVIRKKQPEEAPLNWGAGVRGCIWRRHRTLVHVLRHQRHSRLDRLSERR